MRPFGGPRRVPGLRREELAYLAGVSPDYYSRLEQGRQPTVSVAVLDALARALRLGDLERAHLHDLAAPTRLRRTAGPERSQSADPGLLRLMGALDHLPVLLLGRRHQVLASNALLQAVTGALPPGSSLAHWLFLDPDARSRVASWAHFASAAVGSLRREAGLHPDDHRLVALVDELRTADTDVARWWTDQGVTDHISVSKLIRHPAAGELAFDIETVVSPHDPDQRLVVYTTPAESPTARLLPLLASWGGAAPDDDNASNAATGA